MPQISPKVYRSRLKVVCPWCTIVADECFQGHTKPRSSRPSRLKRTSLPCSYTKCSFRPRRGLVSEASGRPFLSPQPAKRWPQRRKYNQALIESLSSPPRVTQAHSGPAVHEGRKHPHHCRYPYALSSPQSASLPQEEIDRRARTRLSLCPTVADQPGTDQTKPLIFHAFLFFLLHKNPLVLYAE